MIGNVQSAMKVCMEPEHEAGQEVTSSESLKPKLQQFKIPYTA